MPAVFNLHDDLGTALVVSAAANNVSGGTLDARGAGNFAVMTVQTSGNSAIWDLLVSPNNLVFGTGLTVTGTVGSTGFYQISAYYPFVKFAARLIYSAAGGTATINAYYRPGYGR
jgi:hypothetical protein